MSIFTIADLHLCMSDAGKTMEAFAGRWNNYTERLQKNWNAVVSPCDSVIIPGDISWALKLEGALDDLLFIERLNGTKYIGKGNHDLWWSTETKMKKFFNDNGIHTINILYNNAYLVENRIVCGTRGWFYDEKSQKTVTPTDYSKLMRREALRLAMSLEAGHKIMSEQGLSPDSLLLFLHFPPVWDSFVCKELIEVMHRFQIKECYYGHIHGSYSLPFENEYEGIKFKIISSDYQNFIPYLIK